MPTYIIIKQTTRIKVQDPAPNSSEIDDALMFIDDNLEVNIEGAEIIEHTSEWEYEDVT